MANHVDGLDIEPEAWGDVLPFPSASRQRTHYEGCWQAHFECAMAKINAQLEQLDAANKRAKEYVDVFKRVNAAKRVWRKRAEQAEAELVKAQSHLIAGAVYEKLYSINYWKTRVAQAEAERDGLRKELDAANERAATNHATIQSVLAASNSKDKIIAGFNQKVVSANKRAEQAEAALGAAINQRNIAQRFVNENADLIEYWRDLFKRANAEKRAYRRERNLAIATGTTLLQQRDRARDALREWQEGRDVNALADYADTEIRKRAEQAEADARALAERVFETEILTDSEIEIVARYVQREQMERAGYLK